MKHISLVFSLLAGLMLCLISITETACNNKECPEGCLHGGTCDKGICNCPDGYAGINCEIKLNPCYVIGCDTLHSSCDTTGSTPFCVCDMGWEGPACDKNWVDKYIGSYNASEICGGTSDNYTIEVLYAPKELAFTLKYFHNAMSAGVPAKIVADLHSTNNFIITPQPMQFGTVSGAGEYYPSSKSMLVIFTIVPLGTTDTTHCQITLERQ